VHVGEACHDTKTTKSQANAVPYLTNIVLAKALLGIFFLQVFHVCLFDGD
jgi:hypothetical protein